MKAVFILVAVLACAGYSQAKKVVLAAATNGDLSVTYTVGTSQITIPTTVANLLPTIVGVAAGILNDSTKGGTTVAVTLNDNGSLTVGTAPNAFTLPATVVNQSRNVLAFMYNTISTLAQQKNIKGLY